MIGIVEEVDGLLSFECGYCLLVSWIFVGENGDAVCVCSVLKLLK